MVEQIPRIAALDYGQARIGLAISDELGLLAHPRPFIAARPPARALAELVRQLKTEGVSHLLVGLPRNMDGSLGPSAKKAQAFAQALERVVQIPIEFVDERLSTVQAQALLHAAGENARSSKKKIDSASAAVLLQAWLDIHRIGQTP